MGKSVVRLSIVISILSALLACSSEKRAVESGPMAIDYAKAAKMIGSGEPPLILDVRTPQEYAEGHIPGARLVPLNSLTDSLEVLSSFRDDEVIAVCRSGRRSGIAAGQLSKAGFGKVYNLRGGMVKWKQNGGKIE